MTFCDFEKLLKSLQLLLDVYTYQCRCLPPMLMLPQLLPVTVTSQWLISG